MKQIDSHQGEYESTHQDIFSSYESGQEEFSAEVSQVALDLEVAWCSDCIVFLLEGQAVGPQQTRMELCPEAPELPESAYANFIAEHNLNLEERLVLALLLASQLSPQVIDQLRVEGNQARLSLSRKTGYAIPSVGTLVYLLARNRPSEAARILRYFSADHFFYQKSVVELSEAEPHFPSQTQLISLSRSYLELFTLGRFERPRFSSEFPAKLLTTKLEWEDLILNESTAKSLQEVRSYPHLEREMRHGMEMDLHMKNGYRVLLFGPPGTGKTLAVSLLGKELGRETYRVDLSAVVSKYIGETAQNLNRLFNMAEGKGWILFFDEGDALFGQRSQAGGSDNPAAHYGNHDTSYLLQRIEDYRGLIVVATNFAENLDQAFMRRFQAQVRFGMPDPETAQKLWETHLPAKLPLQEPDKLHYILREYPLSPASILRVIQRSVQRTLMDGGKRIAHATLVRTCKDEMLYNKHF